MTYERNCELGVFSEHSIEDANCEIPSSVV